MIARLDQEFSGAIPLIGSCRAGREAVFRNGFSTNRQHIRRVTGKPLSSPDEYGVGAGGRPLHDDGLLSSPDECGVGAGSAISGLASERPVVTRRMWGGCRW